MKARKKMTNKAKRILSLILSLTMVLSSVLLFSCSDKKQNEKIVGTVGGYEVKYEEYRWLTLQFKDRLEETYGEGIWDNEESAAKYLPELQNAVHTSILANYAVLTLCDELNKNTGDSSKFIDINGEEETRITNNYINETIDELGSRAAFRQALKKNYMTEELYRFITGIDVCESILFNYYCSLGLIDDSYDAGIKYIEENFIRTVHVYIENDKGESVEANRTLANAIREKLLAGEKMSDLIAKYGEDSYISAENGYYFTHNTYSEAYEKAAFALEVDQISEVVETYSGFYVIQRLELDTGYILLNYNSKLKNQYLLAEFDKYLEECKATLTFEPNEYGKSLDLIKMK
jgi:foldase protein PrsA